MRKPLRVVAVVLALVSWGALAAQRVPAKRKPPKPKYTVKVAADRADALYEVGDEVRFLVTVALGKEPITSGKLSYVLDDEGPNQLDKGTLELGAKPAAIAGKMGKPGFLRCRVTYTGEAKARGIGVAAAGISPTKIQPSLPAPDDFDAFWADQKARLAKVPMEPKLTPVDARDLKLECFDVQLACLGGAPVSGYFGRPREAKPKSCPAILWVHGAGVRSSSLGSAINGARLGMLSMDINAHGIPNGKPDSFYAELRNGRLKGYPHFGKESRETCYFLGMYLRLVRAMEFLTAQPEWDGKVLVVTGHSQGGGQSIVAGGLDPRVTCIAAGVPAMCDHTGRAANRINGWPKLVPMGRDGKPEPKSLGASRYFDAVNFAARCKADAIVSVGFVDTTCPPTTNYAAYNQLKGRKQVTNEPHMRHAAPTHIKQAFLKFILAHVKARKAQ
jgi:cephalosporin-C deacetylase